MYEYVSVDRVVLLKSKRSTPRVVGLRPTSSMSTKMYFSVSITLSYLEGGGGEVDKHGGHSMKGVVRTPLTRDPIMCNDSCFQINDRPLKHRRACLHVGCVCWYCLHPRHLLDDVGVSLSDARIRPKLVHDLSLDHTNKIKIKIKTKNTHKSTNSLTAQSTTKRTHTTATPNGVFGITRVRELANSRKENIKTKKHIILKSETKKTHPHVRGKLVVGEVEVVALHGKLVAPAHGLDDEGSAPPRPQIAHHRVHLGPLYCGCPTRTYTNTKTHKHENTQTRKHTNTKTRKGVSISRQ